MKDPLLILCMMATAAQADEKIVYPGTDCGSLKDGDVHFETVLGKRPNGGGLIKSMTVVIKSLHVREVFGTPWMGEEDPDNVVVFSKRPSGRESCWPDNPETPKPCVRWELSAPT